MPDAPRTALVTGGARRVGRAVADRLLAAGFDVAITYRASADDAADFARRAAGTGRRGLTIHADLTDLPAAADRVAAEVREHFGRLDVLVHNASVYEPSGLRDATLGQMRRFWAVHCEAPLLLTRALADLLTAARGCVVMMTDAGVDRPMPSFAAYAMSKAALENLTKSLARDLAPAVTVNAIAPGVVEWPDAMPEAERAAYLRRVPLARAGTPADVAELVCFLTTGGRYITGQTIRLDGGRSIR